MAYITDSWDEINRKCSKGLAKTAYALGDLKTITLNWGGSTEDIDMEIIGFDHDDLSDGSGKASITFFSKQLLATYRKMASSNLNTGGWSGKYSLRSWCNDTLFYALPTDCQIVVKEITKLSDGGQNSTSLVSTNDKCWLASPMEIASSWGITTLDGQGTRYEQTKNDGSWAKKAKKGGSAYHWWLRSSTTNDYRWGFMSNGAWASYDNASNTFGIAFGFCVGKADPIEEEKEWYKISKNTLVAFGDEARRLDGIESSLTTAQMLDIFKNVDYNSGSDGSGEINLQDITITENGTYTADSDYDGLGTVTVNVQGSGSGGSGGGSGELNIYYGDTAPSDTEMLWCKCAEPNGVIARSRLDGVESINTSSATLPTALDSIGVGAVGTKIYLFGGYSGSNKNTIQMFDTETEALTTLSTTLPTALSQIGVGVVGTKVYLFGGYGASRANTIQMFDTKTETLTTLSTTLPNGTSNIGVGVLGTKIYLFGGYTSSNIASIRVFDTETETLSTLSITLARNLSNMGVGVVGDKIYLFGGYNGAGTDSIQVFDTKTETITTMSATLPTATYGMGAGVVGTKVYLFGGYASPKLNAIHVFDTETGTLTTLSIVMPLAVEKIRADVVGTKVYLFGGNGSSGYSRTIQVFSVALLLDEDVLFLQTTLSENIFDIITGIELGVKAVYRGNSDGIGESVDSYIYQNESWTLI